MDKFNRVEKALEDIPSIKLERLERPQTGSFPDGGRGMEEVLVIRVNSIKITLDSHCWRWDDD